jgi:polar amino acid transport system permease protein
MRSPDTNEVLATPPKLEQGPSLTGRPHPTRWLGAALSLAVIVAIVVAFARGQIDWSVVGRYVFSPSILQGVVNTVIVSVVAMLLGLVLGLVVALMRLARNPVTNNVAKLYIWVFRGTPLYLQLLIWFNLALVFPTLWFPGVGTVSTTAVMTTFVAAVLGLGINEGAYLAEVIRGGIMSVDLGQTEAAQAIGLNRRQMMLRIVLPQAMPTVIPTIGNEAIGMLKNTALAAAISYTELLTSAQKIYYINGRVMELLFVAAIWYLVATTITSFGQHWLERYFNRSKRRRSR